MASNHLTNKRNLVTYTNPDSMISEQFRTIRTNIKFSSLEKKVTTIQITSPNDGDGKTTTAANLAISMAQHKEKVLLIDANLRNPSVHHVFKTSNNVGLTTFLLDTSSDLTEIVNHTGIGMLDVLTSGPVPINASEIIGSPMMQELLISAARSYDCIIIDSPSILEVTDAKIIANFCDSIILVFNHGKTNMKQAFSTKRILEFAENKIVGVILNDNVRKMKFKLF
ncbi:CpsD/CapB family tyrosine-protein kinase [Peribacillus psychrosaccharolyticus]|nr:CpsD/CapB family tyrosine-protein kinase [Peribacillus psychrosaccharolyticus]MEC2056071.1 CpsD/CapB family tyrosine-protein kinase [Peribacillus psychrosaccharolyticus]MED3745512.1 CpsD/CapB family tyrosine-protein kinase [Peribacillus psychrosaccharolyticus]